MFVYRIAHPKYKSETLSGIGAEKIGGRWNAVGTRAVYCSENISLALLEYYVHSANPSLLPKEIEVAKIYIPDHLKIQELKDLPPHWNHYPYTAETTSIFTELCKSKSFFALKVPSTIVGLESNFVLNPLHSQFHKVKVKEFFKLSVDERLISKI